jgi:hypothetical protein
MDSNFTIKPRPGVQKAYSPRDPVPVRETIETDLDIAKTVAATGDSGTRRDSRQNASQDPHQDQAPHDVVADPDSRDVIYRENDVRAHVNEPVHPDQALLLRAYRPARSDAEDTADSEAHANIKA